MPKIKVRATAEAVTMKLEGVLVGPWVDELERCYDQAQATREERALRVDLTGLTHISHDGQQMLDSIKRAGAVFVSEGNSNDRFLDELKRRAPVGRSGQQDLNRWRSRPR
jgi:hypothetical protein